MSTADEKKEAEVEGELSWSGVKIPDHFHLSWFASVMGWGGVALAINGYPGAKQVRRGANLGGFTWIAPA